MGLSCYSASNHQSIAFGCLLLAAATQLLAHITPCFIVRRTHLWITIISIKQFFSLSHSNTYQVKLHSKFSYPLQRLCIKPWLRFAFTLLALLADTSGGQYTASSGPDQACADFQVCRSHFKGSTRFLNLAKALHLKSLNSLDLIHVRWVNVYESSGMSFGSMPIA